MSLSDGSLCGSVPSSHESLSLPDPGQVVEPPWCPQSSSDASRRFWKVFVFRRWAYQICFFPRRGFGQLSFPGVLQAATIVKPVVTWVLLLMRPTRVITTRARP